MVIRSEGEIAQQRTARVFLQPKKAQRFWQGVYDELGIQVTVPAMPNLTNEQVRSLKKFSFLLIYIPPIDVRRYPKGFVGIYGYDDNWDLRRHTLPGEWVAIETIMKPEYDSNKRGLEYPDDRLMAKLGRTTRSALSYNDLTGGILNHHFIGRFLRIPLRYSLLEEISKLMGFLSQSVLLPSMEQWSFIMNLFYWLRAHRSMPLPDIASTKSSEWCENYYDTEIYGSRVIMGVKSDVSWNGVFSSRPGIQYWGYRRHHTRIEDVGFRVLVAL